MFTEEQIKAIIQENERLRKENDVLSGKVASLEQSLYWLRKKMFGRMSEKNLPLDPNQLSLFTQQEMFMYARIRLLNLQYLFLYSQELTVNMTVLRHLKMQAQKLLQRY